jgi:hypothetical protein
VVRLVDDEDRPGARVGTQARHLTLDLPVERGAGAFDAEAHLPGDGLEEVHDVAGGERDVDDAIEAGVELGEDAARGARLATAAVASDEPDAAQVEQMREADIELAAAGRGKEVVGGDLLAEGVARQCEVFAVHGQKSSSSLRSGKPGAGTLAVLGVRSLVPWSRRTKQLA